MEHGTIMVNANNFSAEVLGLGMLVFQCSAFYRTVVCV